MNNDIQSLRLAAAGHNPRELRLAIERIPLADRGRELGRVLHLTLSPPTPTDPRVAHQPRPFVCAQLLLLNGADPNVLDSRGRMPLHVASCSEYLLGFVERLIAHGANLEGRDRHLQTPLHKAHYVCAELLLNAGANIEALDRNNATPLHHACKDGEEDAVDLLLLHGANIEALTVLGRTPLHNACAQNQRLCAQLLLNVGAQIDSSTNDGVTPLMLACRSRHIECLDLLLQKGANVNAVNELGGTALHMACAGFHNLSLCVELLVAGGADINATDLKGQTPLHWACLYGELETFNALLMAGPNVAATSIRGNTALHCIAKRVYLVDTITGMINGLLAAGANRGARNASGRTPVMIASTIEARNLLLTP